MTSVSVSVVVPCFNEADSVVVVLEDVTRTLQARGAPFEIVVVDDGSTDATGPRVSASGLAHKTIRHRSNRGYGAALKDGIRAATHEQIVVMDADGQHAAEDIGRLLDEAADADMVVGARQGQGAHYWRMPGKLLLKTICEFLVGARIPDVNSGFRVFRRSEALRYMHLCSDQFSFSTSITLAFLSDRLAVRFVPVRARPRLGGRSQVRLATGFSTFMLILRIVGTFSPLRIFMPPTILLLAMGTGYAGWGIWFQCAIPKGAVLCLLGSMVLFCFALLADQLALLRREISRS